MQRLVLKPFQLLKSIVTKKADGDEVSETNETEPIAEDVAITQVENLAVEDEGTEVDATVVDDVTTSADKKEDETPVNVVCTEEKREEEVVTPTTTAAVETETVIPTTTKSSSPSATPEERQATASVDFTGNWTLIVDDGFKSQYDSYLRKLGQPMLVRTVAMTVIGSTKEEAVQSEGGKQLYIRGMNVRGSWERTLEASETDALVEDGMHAVEGHVLKPMVTADEEEVEVAAWWEDGGKVHRSWVVGGKKYGGGKRNFVLFVMVNAIRI